MKQLPRKLNSGEIPGPQWLNQLLEYVQAITPAGSATVRTEETGTRTIFHARGGSSGGIPPSFPGIVIVVDKDFGSKLFYDADLYDLPEGSSGTAIQDNSTDDEGKLGKVDISNPAAPVVTYEDGPVTYPFAADVIYFEIERQAQPFVAYTDRNTETFLPPGGLTGQYLKAAFDGPESLENDMEWTDPPSGLPSGAQGDLLQNNGAGDTDATKGWRALSGATVNDLAYFGDDGLWHFLDVSATYRAVVVFDPATVPAWKVVEPSGSHPSVLVFQSTTGAIEFVDLNSQFKGIWRDENDNAVGDYARAF